jgi:hypothetical protein
MPAVIPPEAFDLWLDCRNVDDNTAAALLVPAPEDLFDAYEISTAVNRVTNDHPGVLEPARPAASATAASESGAPAKSEADSTTRRARKPKKDDRQSSLF